MNKIEKTLLRFEKRNPELSESSKNDSEVLDEVTEDLKRLFTRRSNKHEDERDGKHDG